MTQRALDQTGFSPVHEALPHAGTNGYVSSWGAPLSGGSPDRPIL